MTERSEDALKGPDKEQSPSVTVLSSVCGVHFREECRGCISAKESNDERIEALHVEREKLAYHAEQLATYIAQPAVSEKHLASARWHNDQIRAALSGKDSPDGP